MKHFLKYTLATIVGVLIVHVLLLFLFFGIVGAMASLGDQPAPIKEKSLLHLNFSGTITDKASGNPLSGFDFFSMQPGKSIGLNELLKSIKKAATDDRIEGIYLDLSSIQSDFGGLASAEEIRNALKTFRESGKFIYSYANLGYSQLSYYIASVADSIFVNPETPLLLAGMGGTTFFYKEMLEKMGVHVDIVKVGKYKSAVEPFTQTEMSEENRLQIQAYINSMWGTLLQGISEERNIPVDTLNWLADNLEFRPAETEKAYGLYDGVIYEDEMIALLKEKCGLKADDKLQLAAYNDYRKAAVPGKKTEVSKDKIAVIYASGQIGLAQSETAIGPELAQSIRKAREDKNTKAIVLRVNSPGGSALISDIIWREVELAAQEKPLIASMGNVAASGGYYISCAADTIVADPGTLTGSIGIFGQFFSGEKLFKEKMGIHGSVVKTNKHSDLLGGHPFGLPIGDRPLNEYEKKILQKYIEQGYETFLNRVSRGRHLTRDQVHEVAQGRVWTGEQAVQAGLVDVLGGLEEAVKIAAEKAGLENYRITEYPTEKDFFMELVSGFSASVKTNLLKKELGGYYGVYSQWQEWQNMPQGMMARLPYDISLN
ncbi:MAG: signal peptide peptidase SppA [Culturomica sp.]|jgi:protease-4|nr:signal peptide peptidase SppA [Culturomica sp.]